MAPDRVLPWIIESIYFKLVDDLWELVATNPDEFRATEILSKRI